MWYHIEWQTFEGKIGHCSRSQRNRDQDSGRNLPVIFINNVNLSKSNVMQIFS